MIRAAFLFLLLACAGRADAVMRIDPTAEVLIVGKSMEPTLHAGWTYQIKRTKFSDTRADTILRYKNPVWGVDTCHRARRRVGDGWQMQGDNPRCLPDPGLCTASNYLYEVLPVVVHHP